jgi:NAD(P)-dependent dehydrogenase (short-subunit alcohol dehydrogenase family)
MPELHSALNGQVALVTGAARGIGEAISRRLAAMGATVVLVARDQARLDQVRAEIAGSGGRARVLPVDLLDADAVAAMGATVRADYGRCDIAVNNAGLGGRGGPLHEMAVEDFDRLVATNLRAPYLVTRALVPLMIERGSGHIINISSLAGHNPLPNGAAYSASKWGLNGLTYSVAEELRPHNIRVSVVAPGSVNTDFGSSPGADAARRLQPEDLAHVVAMLVTQAPQSFVSEVLMRPTRKS